MNKIVTWDIYKIEDDYVVAESEKQAVEYLQSQCGPEYEFDVDAIEAIPRERVGQFENETGGYDEMTFGEWLADFSYKGPTIICWNE